MLSQVRPCRTCHPHHLNRSYHRYNNYHYGMISCVIVVVISAVFIRSPSCEAFVIPHLIHNRLPYSQPMLNQRTTRQTKQHALFAKTSGGISSSSSSRKNINNTNNKSKKGFGSTATSASTSPSSTSSTPPPPPAGSSAISQQPRPSTPTVVPVPVVSKKERDVMLQRLQKQYGGTTPSEIATGTQRKMTEYIQQLPSHLQMAVQLYTKLQQYNTTISKLSIYQQTTMFSQPQIDQVRNDQQQLQEIYTTHNLTNTDIHNLIQQMTWDTSAYAKMVQSQLGQMNPNIALRIQTACSYMVDAVVARTMSLEQSTPTHNNNNNCSGGRCLDVGCGYGALIPILTTTTTTTASTVSRHIETISASQIYGLDISTEMIQCGQTLYPDCHFISGDFLQYHPTSSTDHENDDGYFDGIMFCSSLHDMPNIYLALEKAISLLRYDHGSTVVIVHAQGAGHVQMQHVKNPILVPQLLPTASELQTFLDSVNNNKKNSDRMNSPEDGDDDTTTTSTTAKRQLLKLQLTVAPADTNTPNDSAIGYLAVIQYVNE